MPLTGRRGQGAMTSVQGQQKSCGGTVDCQSVNEQRGGQGLGPMAHVLVVLGLDFGALGELETDPLAGLGLAHWSVFLA